MTEDTWQEQDLKYEIQVKEEAIEGVDDIPTLGNLNFLPHLALKTESNRTEGVDYCEEPSTDPLMVKQEPVEDVLLTPCIDSASHQWTTAQQRIHNGGEESIQENTSHHSTGSEHMPVLLQTHFYEAESVESQEQQKELRSVLKILDRKIEELEATLTILRG